MPHIEDAEINDYDDIARKDVQVQEIAMQVDLVNQGNSPGRRPNGSIKGIGSHPKKKTIVHAETATSPSPQKDNMVSAHLDKSNTLAAIE